MFWDKLKSSVWWRKLTNFSPDFQRFFKMHLLVSTIIRINTIFLNIFLIRATGDQSTVIVFNIFLALVQPIAMIVAVKLIRRFSALLIQRIGLMVYMAVYVMLLACGEHAISFIMYIAAALSVAAGFYFPTYFLQLLQYTEYQNRDTALGIISSIGGVITLLLPMLSGLLISLFEGFLGYRIFFTFGFAVSLFSLLCSLKMRKIEVRKGHVRLLALFKRFFTNRSMLAAGMSSLFSGVYMGIMSFFTSILMYRFIPSEFVIGVYGLICGFMSILGSMLYARYADRNNRLRLMFFSVAACLACAMILFIQLNAVTLLLFGIVLAVCSHFFLHPPMVFYMGVVQREPGLSGLETHIHALRELFLTGGRVGGLVMTLMIPTTNIGSTLVILIVLLTQFIALVLCGYMKRNLLESGVQPAA